MTVDPIVAEMARVLGLAAPTGAAPAEQSEQRRHGPGSGRPTRAVIQRRRAANKRARASRKTNRGER